MNVEGKENFIIRNSLIDIRYSNWGKLIGALILVASPRYQSADTRHLNTETSSGKQPEASGQCPSLL